MANGVESQARSDVIVAFIEVVAKILKFELPYEPASFFIRKAAHFSEYALLSALTILAIRKSKLSFSLFFYVFVIPYYDELIQLNTPGRSCQLSDVLLDSFGIITFYLLFKKYKKAD